MARHHRFSSLLLGLALASAALPALAQSANFGSLQLATGFSRAEATVSGHTGGRFPLDRLAARDRQGNRCLGYGSETPDHIITLTDDFNPMALFVRSGDNDTTLMVKGPNGMLLCGDDSGSSPDAMVRAERWPAGTYRVWVGSLQPGQRWRYRLTAQN